jgi:hypothetical protein
MGELVVKVEVEVKVQAQDREDTQRVVARQQQRKECLEGSSIEGLWAGL